MDDRTNVYTKSRQNITVVLVGKKLTLSYVFSCLISHVSNLENVAVNFLSNTSIVSPHLSFQYTYEFSDLRSLDPLTLYDPLLSVPDEGFIPRERKGKNISLVIARLSFSAPVF